MSKQISDIKDLLRDHLKPFMEELKQMKERWERHLNKAIELRAPSGELEMIRWFIRDIENLLK